MSGSGGICGVRTDWVKSMVVPGSAGRSTRGHSSSLSRAHASRSKASCRPSGDQDGCASVPRRNQGIGTSVSSRPSVTETARIRDGRRWSDDCRVKAIAVPSGDQVGSVSRSCPMVPGGASTCGSAPVASATTMRAPPSGCSAL